MEFLFDDRSIDRCAGVHRVLGVPRKQNETVLQPVEPWERGGITSQRAILFDRDEGKFKLWYKAHDNPTPKGIHDPRHTLLCYAESLDGLEWERPHLHLLDYHGSNANNILDEVSDADGATGNVI